MDLTQIGRFKDTAGWRWTETQAARVQHVVDNSTFDQDLLDGDIIVRFVSAPNDDDDNWGYTFRNNRRVEIKKTLNTAQTCYTIMHEQGHMVAGDRLSNADRNNLMNNKLFPQGQYDGWREGPYQWKASEAFAHEFTRVYAGGGANWTNILEDYFRRHFNTPYSDEIAIIENGAGGGDDDDDGDPPFPGFLVFPVAKDLSRRTRVGSTSVKQGSGGDQHLPMGRLGDGPNGQPDWVYDALMKFDLDFIDDIETITDAQLELTVLAEPGGTTHLIGSGDKSFLRAQRVLENWDEGNNAEGTWDASDWDKPQVGSNVASLGTVGQVVTGTRLHYDVMQFVRQWAPGRIKVQGKGAGEGQANHGLRLSMSVADKLAGATEFASSEHGTTAHRPQLRIDYIPVSAVPVAFLTGPIGEVNSNRFTFTGEYTELYGRDVLGEIEWQVRRVGGSDVWTPAARIADSNEEALGIFSIDSSGPGAPTWVVGVDYEWRARVRSKGSRKQSAWTDWEQFEITNVAPTVSATSLGSKPTLANVYFGGPYSDPDQTTANPSTPLGLPKQMMWWPYWKGQSLSAVTSAAATMYSLGIRGVILMGMDWNSPFYELPADIDDKLDAFIAAGIEPWVGLWVKQMDAAEETIALDVWNDGNGKWAGAVVDAEDAWRDYQRDHFSAAVANIHHFTDALRAAGVPLLGVTTYGTPEFIPSLDYELLNEWFDFHMPQVYYQAKQTLKKTRKMLDRSMNSWLDQAEEWESELKPRVYVVNGYGIGANAEARQLYADIVLTAFGAMSWWKWPIENTEVRDVISGIPLDVPTYTTSAVIRMRMQVRAEDEGDAAWSDDTGFLWDTGETALTADEVDNLRIKRLYKGQPLDVGDYTYRVAVQDTNGAWSDWDYGTFDLTVAYQPDLGAYDYLSTYRQQSKVRVRIFDMDENRGPGTVKAIIEDPTHLGCSQVANDIGEFYMTIPTTHPQAAEIEPMQRHYAVEFWRGGNWMPLFEGLIVDMDANEDDVIFYGLDYMGLLSKNIEDAFFTTANPEAGIDNGGSKYIEKTISYVIKDQLKRGHDQTDSPIGFINVEAQGSSVLMEPITSEVTINAAFRERLGFILGLIQSAKQGTGNRSRLYVERLVDGTHRWRFRNNAGVERDNLRLSYGELVQGFRIVLLGDFASTVYGVGRITNEVKPRFKKASAPGIDTNIWGNVALPAVWQDLIDENDLQRRVKQLAMEMGKFGKSVALGLRVSGLEVFDGWDLLDSIPITIQRGAVDTTRYGSGYWTIQGVEYRLEPDGHEELTLAVKPREDTTAPDPDLIPSHPVSTASEWDRADIIGTNLSATSTTVVRDDGTVAAVITTTWDSISEENFDLWAVQVARGVVPANPTDPEPPTDADFSNAILYTTPNSDIDLEDMLPGENYAIRIGAYDTMGNFSGYGTGIYHSAATDDTVPSVPSGLIVTPIINGLLVAWEPVGAPDLDHYDVAYRINGTSDAFVIARTHGTVISLTGLQSSDDGSLQYEVKVRAADTSNNTSAYSATVLAAPVKVQGDDIQPNSITTNHIDTIGLDASVIATGTLTIGGTGTPPVIEIFNSDGVSIGLIDENGILVKDSTNLNRQMRFKEGVLEFSGDGGATWTTSINADGISALAINTGHVPGGHNILPNSSFEMVDFSTTGEHEWTSAGDWGTTIGSDVNADKSTGDLKLSSVAY